MGPIRDRLGSRKIERIFKRAWMSVSRVKEGVCRRKKQRWRWKMRRWLQRQWRWWMREQRPRRWWRRQLCAVVTPGAWKRSLRSVKKKSRILRRRRQCGSGRPCGSESLIQGKLPTRSVVPLSALIKKKKALGYINNCSPKWDWFFSLHSFCIFEVEQSFKLHQLTK